MPQPYLLFARDINAPPIDAADLIRLRDEIVAKTGIVNIVFLPPGMFATHARDYPDDPGEGEEWKKARE